MTISSFMKVKSIAEFSPWSILQYFWPALSHKTNLSWKPICGLFESGRFTPVLLYINPFILIDYPINTDTISME